MGPARERALRLFVGASLLLGAFVLIGGGVAFGTLSGAPPWVLVLAAVLAAGLAALTAAMDRGPRAAIVPATGWIGSVLLAMLWAALDPGGHAFLSGYAAIVAFATGIGILRRGAWAWPVALASVTGFGPIVLVLAPLPSSFATAGFVLFLADVVALLALHESDMRAR